MAVSTNQGSVTNPVKQDPWQYIIEVHWPGGFIIAEVPDHLAYLTTIDPAPDPNTGGTAASPYYSAFDETGAGTPYIDGDEVKQSDFALDLRTTADISGTALTNLASTTGLPTTFPALFGSFKILGPGIPSGARFTFDGGFGGTLSAPIAAPVVRVPVRIFRDNQFYQPTFETVPNAHIQFYREFDGGPPPAYLFLPAAAVYFATGIDVDHFGAATPTAAYDAIVTPGTEYWYVQAYNDHDGTQLQHNGADFDTVYRVDTFGVPGTIDDTTGLMVLFQVIGAWSHTAFGYVINLERVNKVQAMQRNTMGGDTGPVAGHLVPGYAGDPLTGIKLRCYDSGGKIVMASRTVTLNGLYGHSHPQDGAFLDVLDPLTNLTLPPTWTATIPLSDTIPGSDTPLRQFDQNGLI